VALRTPSISIKARIFPTILSFRAPSLAASGFVLASAASEPPRPDAAAALPPLLLSLLS